MMQRVAPWWDRGWKDWWANQRTTLMLEDPDGCLTYDPSRHEARWRGLIAATGGRWAIEIHWGPGTPFFPPLVYSDGYYSRCHQLCDGTLCLAPPEFTEVVEIADWLAQTRVWLDRYVREGWAVTHEEWMWISRFRPHPGYRLHDRPCSYLLLPLDWNPTTTQGEICAFLPRGNSGLGVLRRWRPAGQREWVEWTEGERYAPRDGEEVKGFWLRDPLTSMHRDPKAFLESILARKERHLMAVSVDASAGPSDWGFILHDPDKAAAAADKLLQSSRGTRLARVMSKAFSLMAAQTVIRGLPMRSDELALRTRVSRSDASDASIRSAAVVLVGLGALGSEVAHLLAKEQLGRFLLVDGDLLLPGNIARHRLDLRSVGGNKAEQMSAHITRNHSAAQVTVVPEMLDEALPSLSLPENVIVIGLTGHIPSERVLSAIAAERQMTCLHAWLECDGQVLRLLRTVPGRDPCLHEVAKLPALLWQLAASPPEECADMVLPGSASNIHAAANLVVRSVIDLLNKKLPPENHILFAPDGLELSVGDIPAPLKQRYGIVSTQLRRDSGQS